MDSRSKSINSISLHNSITSQSFASILYDPNASYSFSPPKLHGLLSEFKSSVTLSDFCPYLNSISGHYNNSSQRLLEREFHSTDDVTRYEHDAITQIPNFFYDEHFALEDWATFRSVCQVSGLPENLVLNRSVCQLSENLVLNEELANYLELVDLHLKEKISEKSESFLEVQVMLQELNVHMVETINRVQELRSTLTLLGGEVWGSIENESQINLRIQRRSHLIRALKKICNAKSGQKRWIDIIKENDSDDD